MENHHAINGKIHYKWWFSIAIQWIGFQGKIFTGNHGKIPIESIRIMVLSCIVSRQNQSIDSSL